MAWTLAMWPSEHSVRMAAWVLLALTPIVFLFAVWLLWPPPEEPRSSGQTFTIAPHASPSPPPLRVVDADGDILIELSATGTVTRRLRLTQDGVPVADVRVFIEDFVPMPEAQTVTRSAVTDENGEAVVELSGWMTP